MFERLFQRPFALNRHLNGPLAEERQRFLCHRADQGISLNGLRVLAHYLLACTHYLRLDDRRGEAIPYAEVEEQATLWANRPWHSRSTQPPRSSRGEFLRHACAWLRFLGRLQPPATPHSPFALQIATFADFLLRDKGLNPRKIGVRCDFVRRFLDRIAAKPVSLHDVTLSQIDQALVELLTDEGYARVTTRPITNYWHKKYRVLRGFYRFAKSRGHVTEVPLPTNLPRQSPPFVPYIYSREELSRLLEATGCYQRYQAALEPVTIRTILLLLYGTGLRDGEVIRLNRADVDLHNSLLTVRLTKFHKSRLVPFGPQVCQILAEYAKSRTSPVVRPGEATPFFTTRKGTRIVLQTLQAHFRRVRAQSGIRRTDGARYQPRLHDLRHTFAVHRLTSWYQKGRTCRTWFSSYRSIWDTPSWLIHKPTSA